MAPSSNSQRSSFSVPPSLPSLQKKAKSKEVADNSNRVILHLISRSSASIFAPVMRIEGSIAKEQSLPQLSLRTTNPPKSEVLKD